MFLLTTLNAYNDRANHKSADIFGVYLMKCGIVYVSVNWKSKSLFFFKDTVTLVQYIAKYVMAQV